MRSTFRLVIGLALALLAITPDAALAQASISGVVRDTSGAVLPGVTVETASPALIEKVRAVVTDSTGQYQIVDLRPGTYSVTFTLSSFATVRREDIQLTGTFNAQVNADMRVGALEETIVVTGETPVVDVRSASRERALTKEIVDAIPTSRLFMTTAVLIPGMTISAQDVGGVLGDAMADLTIHGSRTSEERLSVDGMSIGHARRTGSQASGITPNLGSAAEVNVKTSGGLGDAETSGPRVNIVPREGGNRFSASTFLAGSTGAMQASNYTQELRDRGLTTPNEIKRNWDINPSFGGPILRDGLWFYSSFRHLKADNYPAGIFPNVNADNPNSWTYVPDTTYATAERPVDDQYWRSLNLRLTWQMNRKNKFSAFVDDQGRCRCHNFVGATTSPEAATQTVFGGAYGTNRLWQGTWTSPVTNRVLLEAGFTSAPLTNWGNKELEGRDPALYGTMVRVQEQSIGLNYRSLNTVNHQFDHTAVPRVTFSYVTGSHNFKAGYSSNWQYLRNFNVFRHGLDWSYRFANGFVPNPVPNQFTMNATPAENQTILDAKSLFIQDSWTIRRLTLAGGLRYDSFTSTFPEQQMGPGRFVPNPVVYAESTGVDFKDFTPRMNVAYDIFGDGKTAVKANLGKYIVPQDGVSVFGTSLNPMTRTATSTNRSWNDSFFPVGDPRRGNYVPDCDHLDPAANAECGAMANSNFALLVAGQRPPLDETYDPKILSGWGVRPYSWDFAVGLQRELWPRVSMDVLYTRRWYGNFTVTDNLAVGPADFDRYSITAPLDSRLPDGGGYTIADLYNVKPEKFGQVRNFVTAASNFGEQIERYQGVDISMDARPRQGLLVNGGVSLGSTLTDACDVAPKIDNPSTRNCRVSGKVMPQWRAIGSYTIPRIEVQASATFQSNPGQQISANWAVPNAVIATSLGRPLSGGAANEIVNLLLSQELFAERLNQIDVRVGKIVRFGGWRTSLNVDVYNLTNSNIVTSLNNTFNPADATVWQRPQAILAARFVKFSTQIDF
jgi:hypothetical protein